MLEKLLKYDLKWIYKALTVLYILAIVFATIGRGLTQIQDSLILNFIGKVSLGITIAMMINIIINNIMRSWARFIKNMYKDESYLTHTLPVEKCKIYLSKVLASIITMISSALVILICLIIAFYTKENMQTLKNSLDTVATGYKTNTTIFVVATFGVLFLELLFGLMSGYLGIILGNKSNNLKLLKSVVYGFTAYMLASIVTILGLFIVGLVNPNIMNLFNTTDNIDISTIKFVLAGGAILYACYIFVYYIIGDKLLKKGVNVD